jgi:cyanophycin synthetase
MYISTYPEYRETKGACVECGNSPVNHLQTYWVQTLSLWMAGEKKGKVQTLLDSWIDGLAKRIEPIIFRILAALPVTRFGANPQDAATYRSQVIWEEAQRRGIEMEQMILFGMKTEVYRARIRGAWQYFQSLPVPDELSRARYEWIDDKYRLKKALTAIGVSVPRSISVTSAQGMREALRELGGPVVVKPRAGSRGRHTTVHVNDEADALAAFESAQTLCRYVVVEKHVNGNVCRGTVVGGKLVGFFEGCPPRVTGDGCSTVAGLIAAANTDKNERLEDIQLNTESMSFLRRIGYSPDSIPASGSSVALSHRTGRLFGGRTRELLGREHPVLREYLERAAKAVHAPIVGFDLIIPNLEADPDTQEWGIIEANSLPYIDLHYLPLEGEPSNVAAAVWDLWRKE